MGLSRVVLYHRDPVANYSSEEKFVSHHLGVQKDPWAYYLDYQLALGKRIT